MSLPVLAGLVLIGGAGAVARFLLDGGVSARTARVFPWGTLAVNLSGAFALGVLSGAGAGGDLMRLLGVGFLGAYTTFSTWMFETHRQAEDGRLAGAAANLGGSLALGLAAAWAGRKLGLAL